MMKRNHAGPSLISRPLGLILACAMLALMPVKAVAESCFFKADYVDFCGDAEIWEQIPPPAPDIAAQFKYNDVHYAQLVEEGVGTNNGVTPEMIERAMLMNAAAATNTTEDKIPLLGRETVRIDGYEAPMLVYQVNFSGTPFVFANAYVLRETSLVQVMTYAFGSEYSDEHRDITARFFADVRLR